MAKSLYKCSNWKRYQAKKQPCCGCEMCWGKWFMINSIPSEAIAWKISLIHSK